MQICSHLRIVVFLFNVKKSCLHEDQIRFSRNSINNDVNNKMTIQKRSSFFKFYIAIVVDVAILIIVIKRVEIVVVVTSSRFVEIAIDFANNINKHSSIIITIALQIFTSFILISFIVFLASKGLATTILSISTFKLLGSSSLTRIAIF